MMRPADSALPPARGPASRTSNALSILGLACLAVITLASPGATRMYAWPWSLAYAGALLSPVLVLVLRAFDPRRPLVLPAFFWRFAVLASALVVLASALASPYRGPSLQWSAPLLAGLAFFFVAFDALQSAPARSAPLASLMGGFFSVALLASLGLWASRLPGRPLAEIANARNPFPLGHSNYTAGLALLALPWLAILAWRARGLGRKVWAAASLLALAMLFTSGSRGGLLGLGAIAIATLVLAPIATRKKIIVAIACAVIGLLLALAHPRTRAMFARPDPSAEPNLSNVQRTAMLTAGWRMGLDRPLLGWGPGTTPLVYPRYRASLEGGAENVLQLHSAPAQLWAELGTPGLLCALALLTLGFFASRSISHSLIDKRSGDFATPEVRQCQLMDDSLVAAAAGALAGYGAFSLTDWQLDVPVFGFTVAAFAAYLARPSAQPTTPLASRAIGGATLLTLAIVVLLGQADPTPELNVRALSLGRDPAHADEAGALLRQSLALNPDQEIAHFNLGWLLLTRDPADAEKHFLAAARLVPDKGGVYFGLGLARLNQNRRADAARALALECLNDPAFLASPWWRESAIASTRAATAVEFAGLLAQAANLLSANSGWAALQLARVAAFAPHVGEVSTNVGLFYRNEHAYRRERTGYPVLMRNLDLPPPVDLFDVRESTAPANASLPPKGWLPSPLLLQLLDAPPATR